MFDIGGFELLLIAVVGLLVIGPERLPDTLRTLGLWMGRLRRSFSAVRTEIEKEIGMDDIRRQLHNEAVMEEMKRIEAQVKGSFEEPSIAPPTAVEPSSTPLPDASEAETNASPAAPPTSSSDASPRPPTEAELEASYARRQARDSSAQNTDLT